MDRPFENRVAIVSGAGSGIGAAIAEELAAGGAAVIAADISAEAAEATAARLAQSGAKAWAFTVDVADAEAVRRMVDFAVEKGGALHLAVNNAGIGGPSLPTADYGLDEWHHVIDVNLHGVFYAMKYEIPAILAAGGGAIVNMGSILSAVAFANASAYVTAKHGLIGLTKTAALEYGAQGVRINAVGPAFIDTPLLTKNLEQDVLDQLAGLHPIGRIGRPEEVSALTCFLLSERAGFITGSYHLVDGGYTGR